VTIGASAAITRYIIAKGSVAVDGISLTVNSSGDNEFAVSIIPHTAKITTIGIKRIGDPVNIETDMIGKYVERFLMRPASGKSQEMMEKSGIDMDFLVKTGFI
jgi:riboflavin synthase